MYSSVMFKPREIIFGIGALVLLVAAGWWVWQHSFAVWNRPEVVVASAQPDGVKYPVVIRSGPATPTVLTAALSYNGVPAEVGCATCHSTKTPQVATHAGEDLKEFHQGLHYAHGGQSCLSCHNATNYDTLRKADGTTVAFPNVRELCAQCHGPQHRDYLHGTHGGMNGYWDLTRGPRQRNTCSDCHDPHAPAFPQLMPVFPPRDRGALQQRARAAAQEAAADHENSKANQGGNAHE